MQGYGALPAGFPDEGVSPPPPYSPEEESRAIQEIRDRYVIGNLEDPQYFNIPAGGTVKFDYSSMQFNSIIVSCQTGVQVNLWIGDQTGGPLPPVAHIAIPAGLPQQFMFNPKGRIITLGNPGAVAITGAIIVEAL